MCFLSTTFPNAPAHPPILFDQSLTTATKPTGFLQEAHTTLLLVLLVLLLLIIIITIIKIENPLFFYLQYYCLQRNDVYLTIIPRGRVGYEMIDSHEHKI